jgi:hypothetical protein
MADLKHVGRNVTNKRKCIVAYRVVPNAADYCLVVHTESLDSEQHDTLIKLVESNAGQSSYELAEAMIRTRLPDGRNMLHAFHSQGKLNKTLTKDIEMIPNSQTTINLSTLNQMIAESKGVTVEHLALGITTKKEKEKAKAAEAAPDVSEPALAYADEPLSDAMLAGQYRLQADALYKEAKDLQEQANKIDPPKKKATVRAAAKTTVAKKKDISG